MDATGRREFLQGVLAAAGRGAVAAATPAVGAPGEAPPSRRHLDAVISGDEVSVRAWLERDPGLIHARDEAGRSGFALALLHRHAEVGALLRERGHAPDVNESGLAPDWERFERLAAETPGALNRAEPGRPRMLAELIRASDGAHVWVRAYADLSDGRGIGLEIGREIAGKLGLGGAEEPAQASDPSERGDR